MENEYLSDDEKNDNNEEMELTFEEMYPEEEIDEDTLNLIYNTNNSEINFDDFNSPKNKKKDKKKDKVKETCIISLKNLSEKFEEKKVEKWTSKRTEGKRNDSKLDDSNKKIIRYKFNPRLEPYNSITKEYKEKQNSIVIDKNNFPSL
jgi:hypothetical protein